jgi:DNA ligase-1
MAGALRLGAGFSDADRADPPPVGSWVTYRYRGLHAGSGLPRFASFLRVREDMPALSARPPNSY